MSSTLCCANHLSSRRLVCLKFDWRLEAISKKLINRLPYFRVKIAGCFIINVFYKLMQLEERSIGSCKLLFLLIIWCLLHWSSFCDVKGNCKGLSEQTLPFDAVAEFIFVNTCGSRSDKFKWFRSVAFCSQMTDSNYYRTVVSERTSFWVVSQVKISIGWPILWPDIFSLNSNVCLLPSLRCKLSWLCPQSCIVHGELSCGQLWKFGDKFGILLDFHCDGDRVEELLLILLELELVSELATLRWSFHRKWKLVGWAWYELASLAHLVLV